MIGKIKIDKGFYIIIPLMFILLYYFYGDVFLHPNNYLFSANGDGLKNYYTYSYYISNNHSWTNFEGMNFPYGEHFLYTDCTPILALCVKTLSNFFPSIIYYQIGIINSFIFSSFFLAAIFFYLIFRKLKIDFWFSILSAIAYTFLSPQIFRMTGHLALSINCFLPITIYTLMNFEESKKELKNYLKFSLLILFWIGIHAYLGVISFFLLISYFSIQFFFQKYFNVSIFWKDYLKRIIFLLLPLIFFNIFIYLTDNHTGRTNNPYGFFSFYTELKSLFFPTHGRLNRILYQFTSFENRNWESLNYIGIPSILVLFSLIIGAIYNSIRLKKIVFFPTFFNDTFLRILFLASIIVLLFSMCIPFRFHLEFLINNLKVLKQFRALGRFAWVFYFVMSIVTVYVLNGWLLTIKLKGYNWIKKLLIALIPCFIFYESIEYHEETFSKIDHQKNSFLKGNLSKNLEIAIRKIKTSDFQSIIPLPYYYIGSDNFAIQPQNKEIYKVSKLLSYHTKLPLMSSFLTRTSIWESENLVQLFSSSFYEKQIKKDIASKKPILLIVTDENQLNNFQKELVYKSEIINRNKQFSLYKLLPQKLFECSNQIEYTKYQTLKSTLYKHKGYFVSDTSKYFNLYTFDDLKSDVVRNGKGAKCISQKGFIELLNLNTAKLKSNTNYTIRFWAYHGGRKFGQDKLRFTSFVQTTKDSEIKWISDVVSPMNSVEIDNQWSLVELKFNTNNLNKNYQLVINGDFEAETNFYIDDLLIYESDDLIFKEYNNRGKVFLFKNNHQIEIVN